MAESNVTPITAAPGWAPLAFDGVKGFEKMEVLLEACRRLEAQGEAINRANVSAASDVTNNNLVAAGIALYRKRQAALASAPATPASVVEVLTRSVERAFTQIKREFQALVVAEREAFAAALAEAETSEEMLKLRLEGAQQACDEHRLEAFRAQERIETLQVEVAAERERSRALESDYAQSQRDLALAREAIELTRRDAEAARQRHDAQLADQREEHATARHELVEGHEREIALRLQEIDQLRQQLKEQDKATVALSAQQSQEINRLATALTKADSDRAALEKEAERLARAGEAAQQRIEQLAGEAAKVKALQDIHIQAVIDQRQAALEALIQSLLERLPPANPPQNPG